MPIYEITVTIVEHHESDNPDDAGIAAIENINETYNPVSTDNIVSIIKVAETWEQLESQKTPCKGCTDPASCPGKRCICFTCELSQKCNNDKICIFENEGILINPIDLKTSVCDEEGCTCGECGKHCHTNEGGSEKLRDGTTIFSCPYCYKDTVLDETVMPK